MGFTLVAVSEISQRGHSLETLAPILASPTSYLSLNLESYVTGRSLTKPTQLFPLHLENWGAETHIIGKPLITMIGV